MEQEIVANNNQNEETSNVSSQEPEIVTQVVKSDVTKTSNILVVVVAVLVVMAGIQVFQTQQLFAAVSSGAMNAGAPAAQQGGSVSLPSQVGGCG